jgi:CRP-like cAMP-binding protein
MGGGSTPSHAVVQSSGLGYRPKSNELVMTQEPIANMLGVQREGVTEAAGHLQTDGLIR